MSIPDAPSGKRGRGPVGVPRRFAVGTLMVIVAMYSVLFAFLTSLGANPVVFGIVAAFFTGVGVGQVLLFRGKRPRDASFVCGMLLCPAILLVGFLADLLFGASGSSREDISIELIPQFLSIMAYLAILGAPLGYAAGCLTASVFFVMDRIKKAREDSAAEADRPPASATDDVARDERPSLDERLWLPVRRAILGLSPRQKGRPVRGAVNVFIIVGTLVGLAAPFQEWSWWIHLLGTAAAAFVVAFSRGLFLCRWWAVVVLVVLGAVGAIGPGMILSRICLYPLSIPDHMLLVLAVVAGGLVGLLAVAAFGWATWLLRGRDGARQQSKAAKCLGVVTALLLVLIHVAVSLWLFRVSQQPRQKATAMVERLGGVAETWSSNWTSLAVNYVDMDGTLVRNADLECLSVFGNLFSLSLRDTRISDAGLAHLKSLTGLRFLDLGGTRITDAGLGDLGVLSSLRSLRLDGTQVTDAGLEHLQVLTSLSSLRLDGTQVTDAGLEHLQVLTSLSSLHLRGTQVTDVGLGHLQALTSLARLSLHGTQVTDAGLAHVNRLKNLQYLSLSATEVTDAGLEHLKALTSLKGLDLSGTRVTDEGLMRLKALKNLERVYVIDTEVTDAGVEKLQEVLPDCTVVR